MADAPLQFELPAKGRPIEPMDAALLDFLEANIGEITGVAQIGDNEVIVSLASGGKIAFETPFPFDIGRKSELVPPPDARGRNRHQTYLRASPAVPPGVAVVVDPNGVVAMIRPLPQLPEDPSALPHGSVVNLHPTTYADVKRRMSAAGVEPIE